MVRELYEQHRGRYSINTVGGGDLSTVRARPAAVETLRSVLAEFGDWSGDQLSELTHREAPCGGSSCRDSTAGPEHRS